MKVLLFDIENYPDKDLVHEAQDLVRLTTEFELNNPEPGIFKLIAKRPAYYVELKTGADSTVSAKCQCSAFKRTHACKHAMASLLLLREQLSKTRKSAKIENREIVEEVLRKLDRNELKSFIGKYASSHAAFRTDLLSQYMYLVRKPDYSKLYRDLTPVDKYGQFNLARSNIRSVRSVSAALLKRAQQLLLERSIAQAAPILEAVLSNLHRLHAKPSAFRDQLITELKYAYTLFESLCALPMAPRIQLQVTGMVLDICSRASYSIPGQSRPLLAIAEDLFLEEKGKKTAIHIAEEKSFPASSDGIIWMALRCHWMRIWDIEPSAGYMKALAGHLYEVIHVFSSQGDHEDVIFAFKKFAHQGLDPKKNLVIQRAVFRAAGNLNEIEIAGQTAEILALQQFDQEAWDYLAASNGEKAREVLQVIAKTNLPGSNEKADRFLIDGWKDIGRADEILERISESESLPLLMEYDHLLKEKAGQIDQLYAAHIKSVKEQYGGSEARQKLNNIFNHLKQTGRYQAVVERIKQMEKTNGESPQPIKGFVFDLDGVIVDTAMHHFQAWKKIFSQLGADITEEDDQHTRGAGRMESLQYLLDTYKINMSEDEKIECAAKKNDAYLQSIETITPADILPGTLEFLEDARNQGLLIALGSASKNAGTVLRKLGIANMFHAVVDGNDTKSSKPDPEIFQKACASLGLEPSSVVVFEDAPKGVEAALRAGCKVVGIGEHLHLANAHLVISGLGTSTPAQIMEQLA